MQNVLPIPASESLLNSSRDESQLLDVVSSTSEQQLTKDDHANVLKKVSSSFNLDSTDPLEFETHVPSPLSFTSTISLAVVDQTIRIDQEHLDHYYDSDETYLSNTIHAEGTDENKRKSDWEKKPFPLMMNL